MIWNHLSNPNAWHGSSFLLGCPPSIVFTTCAHHLVQSRRRIRNDEKCKEIICLEEYQWSNSMMAWGSCRQRDKISTMQRQNDGVTAGWTGSLCSFLQAITVSDTRWLLLSYMMTTMLSQYTGMFPCISRLSWKQWHQHNEGLAGSLEKWGWHTDDGLRKKH